MGWLGFAQRFPRRLHPGMTALDWGQIARLPSLRAPHASEVLYPDPQLPPAAVPASGEERTLLDAVLAHPKDDQPRIHFADWCDRKGDPRGPFIRHQLATDGIDSIPRAHRIEEERLLDRCRSIWINRFRPWSVEDIGFCRGFPTSMSITGRVLISLGKELFRSAPWEEVRLIAVSPYFDELQTVVELGRLRGLDLAGNQIGRAGLSTLTRCSGLKVLHRLGLAWNGLGDGDPLSLNESFPEVTELSVAGNRFTAAGLDRFGLDADRSWKRLDLSDNPLGPGMGKFLSGIAPSLILDRVGLGDDDFQGLLSSKQPYEVLSLKGNDLTSASLAAFATSPAVAGLKRLCLAGNRFGPREAAVLASGSLPQLRELDLSANPLGDEGLRACLEGGRWTGLRSLDLSATRITDEGAIWLAEAWPGDYLESLRIAGNPKLTEFGQWHLLRRWGLGVVTPQSVIPDAESRS